MPDDPLGLMSDDPLGILGEVPAATAIPGTAIFHQQRRQPLSLGMSAVVPQAGPTPDGKWTPFPEQAPQRQATLGEDVRGGLAGAMGALRRPFLPTEHDREVITAPMDDFGSGTDLTEYPTITRPGQIDPAQQTLRDIAQETTGAPSLQSTLVRGGLGMLPYFNPVTGAASGMGTAQEQGKSIGGQLFNAALGGAFGPAAAGPVRTIQALTRAPAVVAAGAGGAIAGTAMQGATAAETKLFEDMPELAAQEAEAMLPAAGIGGGLAALLTAATGGRGAFRRPYDLRAPAEAPVDVPIAPGIEPAPPGVEAYAEKSLLSPGSRKGEGLEFPGGPSSRGPRAPTDQYTGSPADPLGLMTPEAQGLQSSGAVVYDKAGNPIEIPGGMGLADRPGASPEVVAEGSPVDPFTMQAVPRADPFPAAEPAPIDRTAALGRDVATIQERERAAQNAPVHDPLGILGEEVAASQQAAVRARDIPADPSQTGTQLDAPIVTASGTPRQRPMELRPADAIQDRVRRPGDVDPDMQTQEIDPAIVAELNRAAAEADRAQYGRQIDRLAQRVKGETPEWKAQREEWGQQARRDTTPEGRDAAARDDAEIRARGNRPSETATGMDTVLEPEGGVANLFDSEAAPAPLASWFSDLAAEDKIRTPQARRPVDIEPERRTATEPVSVPVAMGKAKGSDFNRGGFISKAQAAERAKAPESDPNAETRVVKPVDPVEDHIRSMPAEDQAAAREAVKGWDGKSDPEGMIRNIKMAVDGPRELRARKAARIAAKEKANAGSRPPSEEAREVPAREVQAPARAAEDAGSQGAEGAPGVRGRDAGEAGAGDRADAGGADPVRAKLGEEQRPPAAPDALQSRNLSRRGSTVDPIDEAAKALDRGVGAVGRAAGRVASEVSSGEGLLSLIGKAPRYYATSLEQRAGRKGGEVGKEFASRARAANDRARQLEGELAPLLREAHKTIGTSKPARAAGRSLENVEWDGDFGIARSHLAAEGKTDVTPAEAKWQKAYWDLFYASGKQAEDAGMKQMQANGDEIAFKADKNRKEAIRAPDDGLRWLADHPGDADAKKLLAHVAEKNDMKVEELQKVVASAFGERSLERPAALEQARGLKYFPTHMKLGSGEVLPLLRTSPFAMVEALAKRTPTRVAFYEKFGGESPVQGVNEYINAGGERRDAEDLFRGLSGMPVNEPGTGFKPGSGLDTYSRRLGAFIGMMRAASLSVASAVNVPESIAKTLPMVGAKTYVKAVRELFRHPRDAAREMENIGAMTAQEFNWHLEPGRRLEQIEKIASDILGMPLHAVERANVTLAALGGYLKAADLKEGRGTMFDRVRLNWLGFDKAEIDKLMSGKASPDLYQAVATRYPEWTQGHASKASEQSRMAHNKWVGRLTIAERFPRMTVNRFMRATKSIPELWKQGEKGQAAAATALLGAMGLSHAASGAAGLLVRAAIGFQLGSLASSLVQGEDKTNAWKDFLWKSFAGSLFGPSSQAIGTLGGTLAGIGDNDQSVASVMASPIYPLSVAENVTHAARALFKQDPLPGSPFKDLSPADTALKFLQMRLPVTKVASNAAAAAGLGNTDPEMDAAANAFWTWRKKYAPFDGVGGATDYSEFRIAAKKAARMVQGGQDPTPYLEEALMVKMKGGANRKKAFDSLTDSIRGRRLLDDLNDEQRKAAADYLGPATTEKLKKYDALLEAWAQRLKDAR